MPIERRTFIGHAAAAALAPARAVASLQLPDRAFLHHVLFWLADPSNAQHRAAVASSLRRLARIESVRFLHVGTPSVSDLAMEAKATDTSYTFSLLALFDSRAAKEQYLQHPLHVAFVTEFGPRSGVFSKVQIYDALAAPQ